MISFWDQASTAVAITCASLTRSNPKLLNRSKYHHNQRGAYWAFETLTIQRVPYRDAPYEFLFWKSRFCAIPGSHQTLHKVLLPSWYPKSTMRLVPVNVWRSDPCKINPISWDKNPMVSPPRSWLRSGQGAAGWLVCEGYPPKNIIWLVIPDFSVTILFGFDSCFTQRSWGGTWTMSWRRSEDVSRVKDQPQPSEARQKR